MFCTVTFLHFKVFLHVILSLACFICFYVLYVILVTASSVCVAANVTTNNNNNFFHIKSCSQNVDMTILRYVTKTNTTAILTCSITQLNCQFSRITCWDYQHETFAYFKLLVGLSGKYKSVQHNTVLIEAQIPLGLTRHVRRVEPMHFGCDIVEQHSSTRSTGLTRRQRLTTQIVV